MKKVIGLAKLFVLVLLLVSCSGKRTVYVIVDRETPDLHLENLIDPAATYALLVQDAFGDTIMSYHADKLLIPASTVKLVTAAAAWKFLGPEYRIPTYIGYDGFTNENILFGNLIVSGTGDPTLDKRHWYDPEVIFTSWADSLKAHGISEIRGDIIGNDNLFEESHLGSGWAWDDLSFSYAAEFGPLMADNTTVELFINPPENDDADISIMDNLPFNYFSYKNNVTFADSLPEHIHARRINGENILSVYGNYSEDKKSYMKMITADNPTLFFASLLKASLEKAGILISGNPLDIDESKVISENITPLFTHYSPPLRLIIRQFLQDSNNQAGEALLRHLAWNESGYGSFNNGIMILEVFFENICIPKTDYRLADACGLSRYNLITPAALNRILLYMNDIPEFRNCLSQPGYGTLAKRDKLADLDIYAKTGSMSRIDCIAGYLKTARDHNLIFTIMINNYRPGQSNKNQTDNFLRLINHF
ncbi:MAG: D-alanyl-D-alanine carboxypeptidase/D-alanyl-D-alanine-endopeptidase [Candidatus Cloacimonetes bacterium]|nr:D-alanyl-D-alanine carboxypeptidase/D-alanyl-D-alanine-endopeptidase [Candidatus Cloacimonadota bacterium]